MKSKKQEALISYLHVNGATRSHDLALHFGISRATLARWLKILADEVIVIGKARATIIAARRSAPLPESIYRVDEAGELEQLGGLCPLADGAWLAKGNAFPQIWRWGDFAQSIYPGWPWLLEDLRPTGFLGRAFGERMHALMQFDKNPDRWNDSELIRALTQWGNHLPGNFILGEGSLNAFLQEKQGLTSGGQERVSEDTYPDLAERALADGAYFGSSAGGEQPKFTTRLDNRAVIVKFSPPINEAAGRRWADLLVAEHLANTCLHEHGIAAAETRLLRIDQRMFLESTRFDRVGKYGRRGVVSLRALDAAFVGYDGRSWQDSVAVLVELGLVTDEALNTVQCLHAFGTLIANTDMHFGNLSFFLTDTPPLPLAPCYDMLPMLFRPQVSGEVQTPCFHPLQPRPQDKTAWQHTYPLAQRFWHALAKDKRVSQAFRGNALQAKQAVDNLQL